MHKKLIVHGQISSNPVTSCNFVEEGNISLALICATGYFNAIFLSK